MTFNIGDKVRYTPTDGGRWEGLEGIVRGSSSSSSTSVTVTKGNEYIKEGQTAGMYNTNLELIPEEPKTKFKVGDKVRYPESGSNSAWVGTEGEVTGTGKGWHGLNYEVKVTKAGGYQNKEGETVILMESNLELVPSFTFEDIQEGDTIRRTVKRSSGATEVREGVVKGKGGYYWEDGTGYILAYAKTYEGGDVTYELLERPEPKPEPKLWDDAKVGDKLVVPGANNTRVLTKVADDKWSSILIRKDGSACKGFDWFDDSLDTVVARATRKVDFIKA